MPGDPAPTTAVGLPMLTSVPIVAHGQAHEAGGIDPTVYSGFPFGWGIERTYMMKSGTKLDDVRLLYSNDVRFLEQF